MKPKVFTSFKDLASALVKPISEPKAKVKERPQKKKDK